MERRKLLRGGAVAAGVGVAGCLGAATLGGWFQRDADLRFPRFESEEVDDGWEEIESFRTTAFEQSAGPVTVTAEQAQKMLENVGLRREIREKTLGSVDSQLSIAFASLIALSPPLDQTPAEIGRAELMDEIRTTSRQQFEVQLQENGLGDIERTDTSEWLTIGGHEGTIDEYAAVFEIDPIEFEVVEEATIEISGDELAVAGHLASWHNGNFVVVAGGVYPDENFERVVEEQLSELVKVNLEIDLELEPETYLSEIKDIMRRVQ